MAEFSRGLEGVVAAETEMSFIDGQKGVLEYVGIAIGDLAKHSTFEECVYLLWNRRLPKRAELDAFNKELRARYALPDEITTRIGTLPATAEPMHMLRTMVSAMAMHDPDPNNIEPAAARAKALTLLGCAPSIVATFHRARKKLAPVKPDPTLSFSANFLYMLSGTRPTPAMTRAFEICMITHADHGLNNSTFTARVVISTLSDIYSAITAAIGALRGPLHGGANEEVMHMLGEIPSLDAVEPYIMDKLARKDKIMGFGHRVYKAKDPRAFELQSLAEQLARDTGNLDLFLKTRRIEEIMAREVGAKGIYPNVDLYSATTYHCIGLDLDLFTPMFALSRIAGWSGHVLEQLEDNRLFRPGATYTGPHAVTYVPIEQR